MTARPLYEVAHSRAGDKGNSLNLSLIPFDEELYDALVEQVTAERVRLHFSGIVEGEVKRYCLPNVSALNWLFAVERGRVVAQGGSWPC